MPDMQQIVDQEIEEYRSIHGPEEGFRAYFNNFFTRLPTDETTDMTNLRVIAAGLGALDMTPEERYSGHIEGGSDLWKRQTYRQFFDTIDQALLDSGIPIDEVKRLMPLARRGSVEDVKKLNELTLPAYVKLRETGYHREPDLVS